MSETKPGLPRTARCPGTEPRTSALGRSPVREAHAATAHGAGQLRAVLDDIRRAAAPIAGFVIAERVTALGRMG